MKLRLLSVLVLTVLSCVTAQAQTLQPGMAATSTPLDLNLLACHATLAGLTILGMSLSLHRWPWALIKTKQAR